MKNKNKCGIIAVEICKKIKPAPGKKMMQKLFYLVERKGVNLGLNYTIHYFGPYSVILDNMLHIFEAEDIINIDVSTPTHFIESGSCKPEGELEYSEQAILLEVLNEFSNKTPLDLEAMTTMDYVANKMLSINYVDNKIIEKTLVIKGSKFLRADLEKGLSTLVQTGYLSECL